jgi:hypothetical protein
MFYACAIRFDVKTNLKKFLVFEMNLNKGRKGKKKAKEKKEEKPKGRRAGAGGRAKGENMAGAGGERRADFFYNHSRARAPRIVCVHVHVRARFHTLGTSPALASLPAAGAGSLLGCRLPAGLVLGPTPPPLPGERRLLPDRVVVVRRQHGRRQPRLLPLVEASLRLCQVECVRLEALLTSLLIKPCLDSIFLKFSYYSIFIFILQTLSNHEVTRFKRFVSRLQTNCAIIFCFYLYLMLHIFAARFDVVENLEKFFLCV